MPLIQLQYGTENNRKSLAKVTPFIWNGSKEMQIGIASKQNEFPVSLMAGQYSRNAACSDLSVEMGGSIVSASYDVAEGSMVKLFANVKPLGQFSRCAQAIMRVRQDGPTTKIVIPLINAPNSNFSELTCVGKFERISLDEAKAFGYRCSQSFEKFFNPDAIDDAMDFDIISPGIAKEEVEIEKYEDTKTGEEIVRAKPKERRRIILRRNRS